MFPEKYDGEEDWEEYLRQFEDVAKQNGWTTAQKVNQFTGVARSIKTDLPSHITGDYNLFVPTVPWLNILVQRAEKQHFRLSLCNIDIDVVNHLFNADVSVLLAPSPYALQKFVNICQCYASQNEITYNVKIKMFVRVSCLKFVNISMFQMYFWKNVILWVESQKYFGVFLSCNMNDKKDIR